MQNYEILQQIGKGSYGKVYTARNYEDHQLYVLKRIPFDGAKDEADAALREANVLSLLRHPHIVPYKEFFNHEGDLCLIMAHCEGGDLFQHIKRKRKEGQSIEEEQVWKWLVQLLLSLSYCHSKKILHRDVKTQNIFMTADGKLMLGDFGLAKQLQRTMEMARTPIGTPYYMAPEIYEEEPYSYKSDVWALGCVMYEVLAGRPAFAADNLSKVVIKVLKGMYDPLPSVYSEDLRKLVDSMLTINVKKRPSANDILQHPFVVEKVESYLKELSTAGSHAGWSTWRMKLPPTILMQMAQIIAQADRSRPNSAAAGQGGRPLSAGRVPAGGPHLNHHHLTPAMSRVEEDQLSPEELIEKFGLQSLMEGGGGGGAGVGAAAAAAGGAGDKGEQVQLLAAVLHPEDGKKLNIAGEGGLSELRLLRHQVSDVTGGIIPLPV
ncbi:hypothetical protein CEUSTIGMA_g7382.t1 [Chlamydomonas eustigma]|uniref:non-specific serine/threonine protein kinase n=1 Tax=Chlamydomonas eustigma TaxID=1157962 RepID=A0A250XAQ5_9CHLO|nr:hypothetical protein CEUSTIGMA_g7382.t1 [Chlamydomonas eustigma]|eukprot:GAX79942.1 hypothetical protein CEUSTIGMA_g7382.t1 [Chlamydomonas eustigma]